MYKQQEVGKTRKIMLKSMNSDELAVGMARTGIISNNIWLPVELPGHLAVLLPY